jgi:hypothetical protein
MLVVVVWFCLSVIDLMNANSLFGEFTLFVPSSHKKCGGGTYEDEDHKIEVGRCLLTHDLW